MPKDYLSAIIDLTGDSYINPRGAAYGDGSGTHQRPIGSITSIAIHHDAAPRPHDYDSIARYKQEAAGHYARLGPGLQYHYKIDNVGAIFQIRDLTTWLYAVGSSENTSTINICLDGNFENEVPTREQFEALGQLLINLCEQHPEFPATYPNVRPHADYSATACCGANLRGWVYAVNTKADVELIPANAVYDWPEYQPSITPTPAPPAAPDLANAHPVEPVVLDTPPAPAEPVVPVESVPVSEPVPAPVEVPPLETPTPPAPELPVVVAPVDQIIVPSETPNQLPDQSNDIPAPIVVPEKGINNMNKFLSRKFIITVLGIAVAVIGALLGALNAGESLVSVTFIVALYNAVQGVIDHKSV